MRRNLALLLILAVAVPTVAGAATPKTLTILPRTLPLMRVGTYYAYRIRATHGTPPYHYLVSDNPAGFRAQGLSINSVNGIISGTPRRAGTLRFTVAAGDTVSVYGKRHYVVRVLPRNG